MSNRKEKAMLKRYYYDPKGGRSDSLTVYTKKKKKRANIMFSIKRVTL